MGLSELNAEQKLQIKQSMLCEKLNGFLSYSELCEADNLITDKELEDWYGNTNFVDEDFNL